MFRPTTNLPVRQQINHAWKSTDRESDKNRVIVSFCSVEAKELKHKTNSVYGGRFTQMPVFAT